MRATVSPVNHYSEPDYPTCEFLEAHPELLRILPKRWRTKPLVLTALTHKVLKLVKHHGG